MFVLLITSRANYILPLEFWASLFAAMLALDRERGKCFGFVLFEGFELNFSEVCDIGDFSFTQGTINLICFGIDVGLLEFRAALIGAVDRKWH